MTALPSIGQSDTAAGSSAAPPVLVPPVGADHSRFVQRIRRRYAAELPLLPAGLPRREVIAALVGALRDGGPPAGTEAAAAAPGALPKRSLASALRVARQLVLERLAVLDIEAAAPMEDITLAMTELAETTLDIALQAAQAQADARFGTPRNAAGARIDFWIVGMGKLGARELNVSSDIDLVYVYEEDGVTDGVPAGAGAPPDARPVRPGVSAQEYFGQLARTLYTLIGEVTDDGCVFRVDLALRPHGNSGPPAVSLSMLEDYLQAQGREWERFAWLKSRVVAPRASVASGRALPLRALVTAFVYRRYLDYGVFEGLRQLHRKVRDEAQRRAAGRPERANDVKLSRGGIREIEFIVQLLQIVRGGHYPEMRTRSTLKALTKLAEAGLMTPYSAERLAECYTFLRRLEHRIQFLDDQQTHLLPTVDADLVWIARSIGMRCSGSASDLIDLLGATREFVAGEFDALLHDGRPAPGGGPVGKAGCRSCGVPPAPAVDAAGFAERLPSALAERVRRWCDNPKVKALRDDSKARLARLVTRAAEAVRAERCTLDAAVLFVDWIEPLLRRESYLALLVERPEVQNRLLRLLGLARWPMRYLMLHPGVIDELADERLLHGRFDAAEYGAELQARHAAWGRSGQADEEYLLDTLRRAHHAEVFRTLVRDVEGHIGVEQVADDLSALADATLDRALRWAWQHLKQRHREQPAFAVIAYGKLGSKELGYGSDLDVVFLYDDGGSGTPADDDADKAAEVYGAFARKLINWLTLRTAAGELFDIDTALRPNGSSGMLVASLASFEKYQTGRGGNTAWTWEHQAITRARWCAGDPTLKPCFDAVRRAVLSSERDTVALRAEVQAMRAKLREAHRVKPGLFDLKHSAGGMIDVEFAVQALVLAHGRKHPALIDNAGNIALLQRAEAAGLLPPGVGSAAADAYRDLRAAQHRARLDEQPRQVATGTLGAQRDAVLALWEAVFSASPARASGFAPT